MAYPALKDIENLYNRWKPARDAAMNLEYAAAVDMALINYIEMDTKAEDYVPAGKLLYLAIENLDIVELINITSVSQDEEMRRLVRWHYRKAQQLPMLYSAEINSKQFKKTANDYLKICKIYSSMQFGEAMGGGPYDEDNSDLDKQYQNSKEKLESMIKHLNQEQLEIVVKRENLTAKAAEYVLDLQKNP